MVSICPTKAFTISEHSLSSDSGKKGLWIINMEAVDAVEDENKLNEEEKTTLEQKENNEHKINMAEERTIPFEYAAVAAS